MKAWQTTFSGLALFIVVVFSGCSNPADNVPEAKVSAPSGSGGPSAAVDGTTYSFSPGSTISFVGSKVTGSHDGGFKAFNGSFTVAGDDFTTASGEIVIDMNSLWSDSDRLTGHLKNSDFFEVETYPTSTFMLNKVAKNGDEYTVTGSLELHGVTKDIEFPAEISMDGEVIKLVSEFHINRFDFDIKYAGKADDLIRNEVVIKLNMVGVPNA